MLLLIDFINPFGFPGADKLATRALEPRHSAFFASPLELLLAEMQARELVICGLATDMCVQLTAMDAFLREFKAWVPSDCTAAESPAAKKASLEFMAKLRENGIDGLDEVKAATMESDGEISVVKHEGEPRSRAGSVRDKAAG